MALINCPECGKEISNSAEKCVNCGYNIAGVSDEKVKTKFSKKIILLSFIGVAVVSLAVVLIVIFSKPNVEKMLQGTWKNSIVTDFGDYTLYANVEFTFEGNVIHLKETLNGMEVTSESGTYTIEGNNIIIDWDSADSTGANEIPFLIENGELLFSVNSEGETSYKHYK